MNISRSCQHCGPSAMLTVAVLLAFLSPAHASTNVWINSASAKWEIPTNWSLGAPGSNDFIFITNAGTKTVLLDAITSGGFASTMTISNLLLHSTVGATNTLLLSNAGLSVPLDVGDSLELRDHSVMAIDGSVVRVRGLPGLSALLVGTSGSGNRLTITNGGLLLSREATIGLVGTSNVVLVAGTGSRWFNTNGSFSLANSSPGVGLIVSNGAALMTRSSFIGSGSTADGNAVLLTDPGSTWTNALLRLFHTGGQLIISNGATAASTTAEVGFNAGGSNRNVTVTGPGSLWNCAGDLRVGYGGLNDSLTVTDGGAIIVTNATGTASLTVDKATLNVGAGTFKYDKLTLTNGARFNHLSDLVIAPSSGSTSTVNIASTVLQAATNLILAPTGNTVARMNITDGAVLTVTNGTFGVGNNGTLTGGAGTGSVTVSNATVAAASILLGSSVGGNGRMTVAAGGQVVTKGLARNNLTVSGGVVEVVSGPLESYEDPVVHNRIVGGYQRSSSMEITDGMVRTPEMLMGVTGGTVDTLTMSGGTLLVNSNLYVGNCAAGATGLIDLHGGAIYVTNATHDATLILDQGSLTVSNGVLMADRLIATNRCGPSITNYGGTVSVSVIIVDPNGDIDNDCLPNAWEQQHGLNPLSNFGANGDTGDPDGDGRSNLDEYQSGTNPQDPASAFRLLDLTQEQRDMRIRWTTVGGRSYMVELATNAVDGKLQFFSLPESLFVAPPDPNEGTAGYLHAGGATNQAGFYRVYVLP